LVRSEQKQNNWLSEVAPFTIGAKIPPHAILKASDFSKETFEFLSQLSDLQLLVKSAWKWRNQVAIIAFEEVRDEK
jgi:hypothetical protein